LGPVWSAFARLAADAAQAGFRLEVASAYRSYERQLGIWNAKLRGERPVVDDADREINLTALSPLDCLACVLRFSAMPGASRHHWGTDIDVFDAAAVDAGYQLQLNAAEVTPGGPFGPLHAWLDQRISEGQSFGFYRPYDQDRGGVARERWHLSFAPLAAPYQQACCPELLRTLWRDAKAALPAGLERVEGIESLESLESLEGAELLDSQLESLFERFVTRVAEPPQAALEYLPPA
ncbi:MAG: M15 family metallopeptidase, partial [Congregibacter sp.]|nr:M15 family metallopeptidase [Congregibacter sp.]